jgi:hypothetical protein
VPCRGGLRVFGLPEDLGAHQYEAALRVVLDDGGHDAAFRETLVELLDALGHRDVTVETVALVLCARRHSFTPLLPENFSTGQFLP